MIRTLFYKISKPTIQDSFLSRSKVLLSYRKLSSDTTNCSVQRQNFHPECESAINKQINMELYAGYVYLTMAAHFDRDDVALPGFRKLFQASHVEEIDHAMKLIDFQNMRGGRAAFFDIARPKPNKWGDTKSIVLAALKLEMEVNQALLDLSNLATSHNDLNMSDFLDDFLMEQVKGQKALADLLKNVKRVDEGLGIYELDQRLLLHGMQYQGGGKE